MDIYEILDSRPTSLNLSVTAFLKTHGKSRRFQPGDIIMQEGEHSDCIYIVLDGEANIVKTDSLGNRNVLATVTKGTIFGEMGVFLDLKRSATVAAKTKLAVLVLDNKRFVTALQKYPELTFRLLTSLSNKLNHLNDKFMNIVNNKTMIIIGTYILEILEHKADNVDKITLEHTNLIKRTALDQAQAASALTTYHTLNIISELNMGDGDCISFQVNENVLRSYVTSISLAPIG